MLSVAKKHDMDLLQQSGRIFTYGAQVVSLSSWRIEEGLGAVKKSSRQGGTRTVAPGNLCNTEPRQRTVPAGLWRRAVFKAKIFEIQQVQLDPRRAWRVARASCWQFL